jgi:hypothetical protein
MVCVVGGGKLVDEAEDGVSLMGAAALDGKAAFLAADLEGCAWGGLGVVD